MSVRFLSIVLLGCLGLLVACGKAPKTPRVLPLITAPPAETRPFEEGYAVGFEGGRSAGAPDAKAPRVEELEARAARAAESDPLRANKWQRGWVAGYLDGFRLSSHRTP